MSLNLGQISANMNKKSSDETKKGKKKKPQINQEVNTTSCEQLYLFYVTEILI